jgi:PKD repeat protein
VAVLGVLVPSAAAHPRVHPSGHVLGVVARAQTGRAPSLVALTTPLSYHGGPVQHDLTVRTIFWNPSGMGLSFPPGYITLVNRFYTDVAHDSGHTNNPYASVVQYPDGIGPAAYRSTFGGSFTVNDPLPGQDCSDPAFPGPGVGPPCILDQDLTAEIAKVMADNGLAPHDDDYYALYLPQGIVDCADDGLGGLACSTDKYCAYHSSFTEGSSPANILYANEPYPVVPAGDTILGSCATGATPNGNQPADDIIDTSSHEQNETVTDPLGTGWWDDKTGEENGDKCNFTFGTPLGGSLSTRWNAVINGNEYWIQQEWSNDDMACVTKYTDPIAGTFTMTPPSNAEAGQSVGFSASTADGAGVIGIYRWSFGDGSATVSSSASGRTHTFAAPGTYRVSLTAADSTRAGGSDQDVTILRGPAAAFSVPAGVPSGSPASFDASASTSSSAIATYSWAFGDGQTAGTAGATTTHAYAHPGAYQVALTVTDAAGVSATVQHAVTVTNRPPVAAATASPARVVAGSAVAFSGQGSRDPDGSVASYAWSFGDGTSGSGASVSHIYRHSGTFTATLTVRDNSGATDAATVAVRVTAPPPCVVPGLRGLSLPRARTRLAAAHCSLGRVRHAHSATVSSGHVLSSSPGRSTHRAHGARVSVTISSGP